MSRDQEIDQLFDKVVTIVIAEKIIKESDLNRRLRASWKAKNKERIRIQAKAYQKEYRSMERNRKKRVLYMRLWRAKQKAKANIFI